MNLPERWYRDLWLVVITGLVAWALLSQQGQITDVRQVQDDTARLARQTARLAKSIQAQRVNSVLSNCRDQNERHDDTLDKLDGVIANMPPGPEKVRAEANKPATVLLIDALVPRRNCHRVLRKALTPAPKRDQELTP